MCVLVGDRQLSEKSRQLITHSKMQQSRVPVPREQYDGSQTQNRFGECCGGCWYTYPTPLQKGDIHLLNKYLL